MKKIELNKIAKKLQHLEIIELRDSGLKNRNGGFAIVEMYDYDDEILYVTVQTGVQTGNDDFSSTVRDRKINRETLEWYTIPDPNAVDCNNCDGQDFHLDEICPDCGRDNFTK
jgi:hypothetical protein